MRFTSSFLNVAAALLLVTSAEAHHFRFSAPLLTGVDEPTPNNSSAIGAALVTLDEDEATMRIQVSFNGLAGAVTSANVYAVTGDPLSGIGLPVLQDASLEPAMTTLPDFPTGEVEGTYDRTVNLALAETYDPIFLTTYGGTGFDNVSNAFNTLANGLFDGKAYLNINTTAYPNGEIRGFLVYLLGDYNNDSFVDAADYTVWRDSLGVTGEDLDADSNNSNSIDDVDYDAWKENFGHSRNDLLGGGSGSDAVPEPTSAALLLGFALMRAGVRVRRSNACRGLIYTDIG